MLAPLAPAPTVPGPVTPQEEHKGSTTPEEPPTPPAEPEEEHKGSTTPEEPPTPPAEPEEEHKGSTTPEEPPTPPAEPEEEHKGSTTPEEPPTPPAEPEEEHKGSTTPEEPPTPPAEPGEEPAPKEPAGPFRFFGPNSVWNKALPANAPLDPSSSALVGAFNQEITKEIPKNELNINATAYSVPIYTVPANQPTVKVLLNKPNASRNSLQTAWNAVPLPATAQPAKGTDKHLLVWQPSTDKMWEFWAFEKGASGPLAQWGGAIEKASSSPGVYDSTAWSGAQNTWGASGTSLPIAGGLITLEDLEQGKINHALALAIPNARAKVYTTPAQRTDGQSTNPLSLPEGARLRLDPNLDLSTLHLPKLTLMMAEAAQRYGIIVRDKSTNITFFAQDPTPTGTNPFLGLQGYFEGKCPCKLLASFPWSHLQLLKMETTTLP